MADPIDWLLNLLAQLFQRFKQLCVSKRLILVYKNKKTSYNSVLQYI